MPPCPRRIIASFLSLLIAGGACMPGCAAAPRNTAAVESYYAYDFRRAREALRADAEESRDEQVLLNNVSLGMAALADGDVREAERALDRSFDMLSSPGLNADRAAAAVLAHEGVRVWKGEPFEQALAYHYVATLYAVLGDWENARAASANALFRLADFRASRAAATGGAQSADAGFALGYLMEAIASDLSGAAGAAAQFEAAARLEPGLQSVIEKLVTRDYDTLLIVDFGKGPAKIAYGPDDSLAQFVPCEPGHGPMVISIDGAVAARARPVCDVGAMARAYTWNGLQGVRRAKSAIGDGLMIGGAIAASGHGGRSEGLVGAGMWLAGLLTKQGARADTRYLEFAPASIFLVPLSLGRPSELAVEVPSGRMRVRGTGARIVLPRVDPGTVGAPRTLYLRLHDHSPPPVHSEPLT